MPTRKMPRNRSRIFHLPKGVPRMFGNSLFGIWLAARLGFRWIDLDILITRDGVVVVGHWPLIRKDRFIIPRWFTLKYGRNPKVSQVFYADLVQLKTGWLHWRRHKRRQFRYITLDRALQAVAATRRLGAAVEAKPDRRFELVETWLGIKTSLNRWSLSRDRFQAMTLASLGAHPNLRLRGAKQAGVGPTVLLARGPVPVSWEPDIDYVRGKWRRAFGR